MKGGVAHLPVELRGDRRLAFDDHDVVTSVENWDVIEAMKTVSCHAGHAVGGLARQFAQFLDDARRGGELKRYFAPAARPGDEGRAGRVVGQGLARWVARWTPVRFDPGWRWHVEGELWDRKVAGLVEPGMECFVGFAGMALHSFRAARAMGCPRLELVAAGAHVDHCFARHAEAARRHPGIEQSWLTDAHRRKTLAEYAAADVIWCASEHARETFVRAGVNGRKLRRTHCKADARFAPDGTLRPDDGVFRVVYAGPLTVTNGVPLVLEAVGQLGGRAELTLVGEAASRGMRRYLEASVRRDPRVRVVTGDPLPHLRWADVCVQAGWDDQPAWAALDAMLANVPVIVTADTGLRERVVEGRNGYVVPTGDVGAIVERMKYLAAGR